MGRPKLPEGEAIKRKYARNKRWRDANREKMNAYSRSRNLDPERREYMKNYAAENADSLRDYKKSHWNKYRVENRRMRGGLYPEPTRPMPDLCECCGGLPNGQGVFHLDHDHKTGGFRGWLCHKCNVGIGMLGDDVGGIKLAIAYLSRITKTESSPHGG